jgi:predicted ABC-type ATPase
MLTEVKTVAQASAVAFPERIYYDSSMTTTASAEAKPIQGPILMLIRGLPGSGKTYLAAEIQRALGAENIVMLDPDATDYNSAEYLAHVKEMDKQGIEAKFHPYRFNRIKAEKATVDGKIIIWNQPFTLLGGFQRTIAHLQAQAKEQGIALPILVVEVNADPQVAKKRVMSRKQQGGHGPSEATFDRFITEYVSFASEGHPTVIVQGDGNVQQSLDAVLAALREL